MLELVGAVASLGVTLVLVLGAMLVVSVVMLSFMAALIAGTYLTPSAIRRRLLRLRRLVPEPRGLPGGGLVQGDDAGGGTASGRPAAPATGRSSARTPAVPAPARGAAGHIPGRTVTGTAYRPGTAGTAAAARPATAPAASGRDPDRFAGAGVGPLPRRQPKRPPAPAPEPAPEARRERAVPRPGAPDDAERPAA